MGLGLLLLTAGAFVRFVLGRYAGMNGVLDPPGAVLLTLGVIAIAVALVTEVGAHLHVVRAHRDPELSDSDPGRV